MREEEVKKCIEAAGKEDFHTRLRTAMCWADADGKVTRENFQAYYAANAKEGDTSTVRITLFNKFGYRNDLRKSARPGDPEDVMQVRKIEEMPRYKIANNRTYFDILRKLCSPLLSTAAAIRTASTLSTMLCTNKSILNDVYWLHDRPEGTGTFQWEMIFPDDTDATMYTLEIVDSILKKACSEEDPTYSDVTIYQSDWVVRFL